MLVCETGQMSELARKLTEELKTQSYRDLEGKTGVSRGAIEGIVREELKEFPKLETLDKLATYWNLPLWRVIAMAGIDLGYPQTMDDLSVQLTSLAQRLPEIEPIVQYLLKLYPDDLRGVMAYLEALDRQYSRDKGWSGEDASPHQQGD